MGTKRKSKRNRRKRRSGPKVGGLRIKLTAIQGTVLGVAKIRGLLTGEDIMRGRLKMEER